MMKIKLPEKVRGFLVPGILLLAIVFIAGGFYFRNKGLSLLLPQITPEEEGTVSGARTGVPENFPEDIPLFEPAEIVSSLSSQERIQVTLQTEASAERVLKFYRQKMEDLGWRLTVPSTFSKNGRRLQLTITSNPEGPTLIILSVTPYN